jgi:uncharacterized protein
MDDNMDKHCSPLPKLLLGLFICIGLSVAGLAVNHGLTRFKSSEKSVSVKGLAEKEVVADLALWSLRFATTGNDLTALQNKIENDAGIISAFLIKQGFKAEDITPQRLEVVDLLANQYRGNGAETNRFIISGTLLLRSNDVERVEKASSQTGELVKKGVVLDNSNTSYNIPYYLFTKLNDIKPEMIAQATRNARDAAQQFAKDSGSTLGDIRTASQGYFSILPRNQIPGVEEPTQKLKTVRIVTTIDYSLGQ